MVDSDVHPLARGRDDIHKVISDGVLKACVGDHFGPLMWAWDGVAVLEALWWSHRANGVAALDRGDQDALGVPVGQKPDHLCLIPKAGRRAQRETLVETLCA